MWIVMTSRKSMPGSVRAEYRRIALVQVSQYLAAHGLQPKMISPRAKGVLQMVDMGYYCVGTTMRSRYQQVLKLANDHAYALNNAPTSDATELLTTWGGSA